MDETLPPKKPFWVSSTRGDGELPVGADAEPIPTQIGPYRVVERLGTGSMGNVYRCHDATLDREVAVKVLKAQYAGDEHYHRRFRREARAVASLSHRCVVQIYSIHEEITGAKDSTFIVMELVSGASADDILAATGGPVSLERAALWIRDAAAGLREAAAKAIIHRDVKPSNILVTPEDKAKIVDFGLAKELGEKNGLTQEGIVLGTPHYLSPEQGRGRALDHRTDIYSLGATFYHLVTGRPPFDGDSQVAVIVAHVNESPIAPHAERPELPESATRVIFHMMAKSPADRYSDYDELIDDLDALIAGEEPPHAAGSVEGLTPVPRVAAGRRRRLKLALALAAVLLGGGIAFVPGQPDRITLSDLGNRLGPWCSFMDGYRFEFDADFTRLPPDTDLERLEDMLRGALVLPPGVLSRVTSSETERPHVRAGALRWSEFETPFAFAFSFERLEEAEISMGATEADAAGDLDLAFSLVHPHGAHLRQLVFRIAPRQGKKQPLVLAYERNAPVEPIELTLVRDTIAPGGGRRALPFVHRAPVLGAGPFTLKLELEPRAASTRVEVTITKPAQERRTARSYRLSAEFPGTDWARGVPQLATEAIRPFTAALERIVLKGELARDFTVTEIPWQR